MHIKKNCFIRNCFPKQSLLDMSLFTVQDIIHHYSPSDITDNCIVDARWTKNRVRLEKERENKEATLSCHSIWHSGNTADQPPEGCFYSHCIMKNDITRTCLKEKHMTMWFQGVSPKHRHRHKGALGWLQEEQGEAGGDAMTGNGKRWAGTTWNRLHEAMKSHHPIMLPASPFAAAHLYRKVPNPMERGHICAFARISHLPGLVQTQQLLSRLSQGSSNPLFILF